MLVDGASAIALGLARAIAAAERGSAQRFTGCRALECRRSEQRFELKETARAARSVAIILEPAGVRGSADFDKTFAAILRARPNALVVLSDPLTLSHSRQIVDFVSTNRLPIIS
jgi:hypothetical protein